MSLFTWGLTPPSSANAKAWFGARMVVEGDELKYQIRFLSDRAGFYGDEESEEGQLIKRLLHGQDFGLMMTLLNRKMNEGEMLFGAQKTFEWELPCGVRGIADSCASHGYIYVCIYK